MRFLLAILAMAFASSAGAADADSYPNRPVTIVVPYTAGGGVDTVTRILAPLLSQRLGQPVLIENRAGVSGMVGSQMVARAKLRAASPEAAGLALESGFFIFLLRLWPEPKANASAPPSLY